MSAILLSAPARDSRFVFHAVQLRWCWWHELKSLFTALRAIIQWGFFSSWVGDGDTPDAREDWSPEYRVGRWRRRRNIEGGADGWISVCCIVVSGSSFVLMLLGWPEVGNECVNQNGV